MEFSEWLDYGVNKGWLSEPTCYFHDMLPISDEEEKEIDEQGETCLTVSRFYQENIGGK